MTRHEESDVQPRDLVDGPRWGRRHAWTLAGAFAILITGMAFSFWWNPLTHHGSSWYTPTDLWSTFRASQYVGWGFEGEIYKSHTLFDTFPGIAVLLSPIAKLSGLWHLSEGFPIPLNMPTAWFMLGPANLIFGGVLLFPLDSLARRLLVPAKRRVLLVWLEAALVWPVVVLWGHPEYALALAFGVYGLLAAFDKSWGRVGVFFGLALLFQPLTLLMLPVAISYIPARRWIRLASVTALPSALLLIPPLVKEWSATTYTLLRQPNYPVGDHPTPWLSLAPVLRRGYFGAARVAKVVTQPDGKQKLEEVLVKVQHSAIVSAGPGRLIAIVLACGIGVWVAKKKPPLQHAVWWVALALSLRCVFESVMNPYYLMPGIAIILVVASMLSTFRLIVTVLAAGGCTYLSYSHLSPWHYYLLVTGLLIMVLFSAWPAKSWFSPRDELMQSRENGLVAHSEGLEVNPLP